MSSHTATVRWTNANGAFGKGRYSRNHQWEFDGGALVMASASPAHVPPGTANSSLVDPEEGFIAALSSCHMLFFLDFARLAGLEVGSYVDEAHGLLEKNAAGTYAMVLVTLRPLVEWIGSEPSPEVVSGLYRDAHEACFITNSIKTAVKVEPR